LSQIAVKWNSTIGASLKKIEEAQRTAIMDILSIDHYDRPVVRFDKDISLSELEHANSQVKK
jgi:hypothetical protein